VLIGKELEIKKHLLYLILSVILILVISINLMKIKKIHGLSLKIKYKKIEMMISISKISLEKEISKVKEVY